MAATRDVQKIIHRYVRQTGSPRFSIEPLQEYVRKFVNRYSEEHPELGLLVGEQGTEVLHNALNELEQSEVLQLQRNETSKLITHVYYAAFYGVEIQRWYTKMNENRELPFPGETNLDVQIPTELLQSVDVADSLMYWIESTEADPGQILLLRFPDGVDSLLITVKALREQALPLVLTKIRDYLRTDKNASFLETKLRSIFPTREMLVHDEIETAQARPDNALQSIVNPNDFQFHFWTQLSSMIIKEYSKKNEKLDMEHGFCQAAYMLGYYAVFHKGRAQKDHQREEARKLLRTGLQKPPFVFGIKDLHKLADDRGVTLDKKAPTEEINQWIEEMLRRPSDREISELVTIDLPEQKGLIIHSAQYVPLLRRQVKAAGPVLKRELTNAMITALSDELREEWIEDDQRFEEFLRNRVREGFPLLSGLLNFKTLFLVIDGQELPADQKDAAMGMIDRTRKEIRPWAEILEIDRRDMYKDARLQLPVWMIIPIVRGIVRLLRAMFSASPPGQTKERTRRKSNRDSSSDSRSPQAEDQSESSGDRDAKLHKFREALSAMQSEYLAPAQTADQRLKQLRESWNPLIDPVAHENLVEDVNALCRDTLRRMRSVKTLQAPDHEGIKEQARRIAENKAFDRIKRRREFETYLELYMITTLHRA